MGLFGRKRKPETIGQITDRVIREFGGPTPPPDDPGTLSMINPDFMRRLAKEIKKAKDRGLLVEGDEGQAPDPSGPG